MRSLKKVYEIWEERPRIIAQKITTEADFFHMVHHLESYGQILHISMSQAVNKPKQPRAVSKNIS